jgi:hypothetical protein
MHINNFKTTMNDTDFSIHLTLGEIKALRQIINQNPESELLKVFASHMMCGISEAIHGDAQKTWRESECLGFNALAPLRAERV